MAAAPIFQQQRRGAQPRDKERTGTLIRRRARRRSSRKRSRGERPPVPFRLRRNAKKRGGEKGRMAVLGGGGGRVGGQKSRQGGAFAVVSRAEEKRGQRKGVCVGTHNRGRVDREQRNVCVCGGRLVCVWGSTGTVLCAPSCCPHQRGQFVSARAGASAPSAVCNQRRVEASRGAALSGIDGRPAIRCRTVIRRVRGGGCQHGRAAGQSTALYIRRRVCLCVCVYGLPAWCGSKAVRRWRAAAAPLLVCPVAGGQSKAPPGLQRF